MYACHRARGLATACRCRIVGVTTPSRIRAIDSAPSPRPLS
jgi:hypothetical protein